MLATRFVRLACAFLIAVVITAAAASVVQTQINISAIEAIGPAVPAGLRASVTGEDLLRFGPVMAAIAAGALLPAFAAAALAARVLPRLRVTVFAAAGVAGLWAAFVLMGFFTPMPTLVAAARGAFGLAALCATGALGGLAFALVSPGRPAHRTRLNG